MKRSNACLYLHILKFVSFGIYLTCETDKVLFSILLQSGIVRIKPNAQDMQEFTDELQEYVAGRPSEKCLQFVEHVTHRVDKHNKFFANDICYFLEVGKLRVSETDWVL